MSETPDLVDPIVGWRCWRVLSDGTLMPLNGGSMSYATNGWEPRNALRASCPKSRETAAMYTGMRVTGSTNEHAHAHAYGPVEGCTCGYYAAKLLAKAQWPEANYAYGRVAMWGKVIEHEGGYRAEYAYPIEVILVPKAGTLRHYNGVSGPTTTETVEAWSDERSEYIRLRMETMYGIPVRIGSDDAMRDEWAAQYLDLPLPPQVVPLLEAAR